MGSVTRQITAATAPRKFQLDIRVAKNSDITVAPSIDLQARKEHSSHPSRGRKIEKLLNAERARRSAVHHPIVGGRREERRLRVNSIGGASYQNHARSMGAFRHMHGELNKRRAESVEHEHSILDRAGLGPQSSSCRGNSFASWYRFFQVEPLPTLISFVPGGKPGAGLLAAYSIKIA